MHEDAAREAFGAEDVVKLASNESPWGPHPAVIEAIAEAAEGPQPLPGPARAPSAPADRRALRHRSRAGRGRQRLLRDPARRRRGAVRARRRDPLRLAGVLHLPAPGGALRGARDPRPARRGLRPRPRRDAGRDHRGHPARLRLQPEQPDRDPHPGGADRRLLRAGARPRHRGARRGLRRVPDQRRSRRHRRPAGRASPTWSSCGRSARCTGSPACAAATRSARPSSAPRSTRCASRSASTSWPRRPPPRRSCTATTSPSASSERSSSGSSSRRGCASSASIPPTRRPTSRGSRSADRDEAEVIQSLGRAGIVVRGGEAARRPRPHARHLRHPRREPALPRRPGGRRSEPRNLRESARPCYKPGR